MDKAEKYLEELAQEFYDSLPKINPQVFEVVANLHSKIPTINPALLDSIERTQDKIAQMTQPIQDVQKALEKINTNLLNNNIFNIISQTQNQLNTIFSSPGFKNFQHILEQNQAIYKNIVSQIDFDTLYKKLEENTNSQLYVEQYKEQFTKEEQKEIDSLTQTMANIFPEVKSFIESIENIKYKSAILAIVIFIVFRVIPLLMIYNNYFQNQGYIINRENTRLRTSPTTSTNDNIVKKLHYNEYVEKIGKENGWIKVRYDIEDGKQVEGWIYQTLLTKVE